MLSSDEVGSSRMTTWAGVSVTVKARAISTICRRAIESVPASLPRSIPWPGKIASSMPPISARGAALPAGAARARDA